MKAKEPTFSDAEPVGFEFELADGTKVPLPLTFAPNGGIGYNLSTQLERAPGSTKWFTTGDGLPIPEPLTLSGLVIAPSEYHATLMLRDLLDAQKHAVKLWRGQIRYRALIPQPYPYASLTPAFDRPDAWSVTLTLLPTGPHWTPGATLALGDAPLGAFPLGEGYDGTEELPI
ncbi:hypothetical protein [Deinococcus peraridilitoris]|uniref:Uncharacterized protein n=1 Tax=Deinococcus peraridilitoris (strain DSM 19664 / LMG 22246 / CIP 109416 / KR-200) TaxID=937777 RepID=L0A3J7_DEIPD|nr:hypothetical protein [Deinococcus peraridilitoris]AFZ67580.1 hypothetical protein Deipe_2084 [Deinococcus peraridilitoris DSM 19664]